MKIDRRRLAIAGAITVGVSGDWAAMRHAAEATVSGTNPSVHDLLALVTACRNLGDFAAASDAADRAWRHAPGSQEAAMVRALVALERGDGELAISRYRELVGLVPNNPRWTYELVRLLEMVGRIDEAVRELDAALERMPADPLLWNLAVDSDFRTLQDAAAVGLRGVSQGLYAALEGRTPADDQLRRPALSDHKLRDVLVAPALRPGNALVLVFTGGNDTVGMPLPTFDRHLASLGCSAVYLKDFRRLLYLRGVQSLGNLTETLRAIRQLQSQLGCERLCTIGASGGGFAAIHYGVNLAADRILSFAGPTHRVPGLDGFPVLKRHEAAFLPNEEVDLRAFLKGQCHSSHIHLFFGDQEPRDRAHALYLDGLDGVSLHPVRELNDHQCLRWFALNQDLRALLGEWLGT